MIYPLPLILIPAFLYVSAVLVCTVFLLFTLPPGPKDHSSKSLYGKYLSLLSIRNDWTYTTFEDNVSKTETAVSKTGDVITGLIYTNQTGVSSFETTVDIPRADGIKGSLISGSSSRDITIDVEEGNRISVYLNRSPLQTTEEVVISFSYAYSCYDNFYV